jgi:hypothetical protein
VAALIECSAGSQEKSRWKAVNLMILLGEDACERGLGRNQPIRKSVSTTILLYYIIVVI